MIQIIYSVNPRFMTVGKRLGGLPFLEERYDDIIFEQQARETQVYS